VRRRISLPIAVLDEACGPHEAGARNVAKA
jgi:hypothetical protein